MPRYTRRGSGGWQHGEREAIEAIKMRAAQAVIILDLKAELAAAHVEIETLKSPQPDATKAIK